jgi:peptidoglycan/xylan/chitin deacetylase (PgdA/CDA1 family)
MLPSPRLLLTIDYESWFAPSRRYDFLPSADRHALDDGFARDALDPLLERLGDSKISFYLVGELVEWYPDLPKKIRAAGHEVGFHCQVHRLLNSLDDIEHDLQTSTAWRAEHHVVGFRAPMVNTIEAVYPLLEKSGFIYSSSLYAPTGTILKKGTIWELPVSTFPLLGHPSSLNAPRNMTLPLVLGGEFPYGSSMMSGLFTRAVFKIIEKEFKAGRSPVIFLHPYEIIPPARWPRRFARDILANPLLFPFTFSKAKFLADLLREFPTSTLESFVRENLQ